MPEENESKKSFGLFVGVGQRKDDEVAMQISADDARIIREAFATYCKLNDLEGPVLNKQANKDNIFQKLDNLIAQTANTPADFVVVYFSGHGCEFDRNYYLICDDTTKTNVEETAINGNEFLQKLRAINADKMLVLLDCCHSGGVANLPRSDIPFSDRQFLDKPNHVVITACHKTEVSYVSRPVSIFTYALIEGLGGWYLKEDQDVKLFDLAMYIRERVAWLAENNLQQDKQKTQKPQMYVLQESQTTNFTIARHPKKPGKKFFKAELQAIKDMDGKELNVEEGRKEDKEFRNNFTWIKPEINNSNTQTGDGSSSNQAGRDQQITQIINNNITNNNHIYATAPSDPGIKSAPVSDESKKITEERKRILQKREIIKKYADICASNRKVRKFIITFNGNSDIKLSEFNHQSKIELQNIGTLTADELIKDLLCHDTIDYCYETVRASGEDLKIDTRSNLSALIGNYLFKILLNNPEGKKLIDSFNKNENRLAEEKEDVQMILNFSQDNEADKLSLWPWEYLHCSNENLNNGDKYFLLSRIKITRVLYKDELKKAHTVSNVEKLKVLVFFCPKKDTYNDDDISSLENMLLELKAYYGDTYNKEKGIWEIGNFEYFFLYPPKKTEKKDLQTTYQYFKTTINIHKPNIIHFVGEAELDSKGNESLYFWKKQGKEDITESRNLENAFYSDIKDIISRNPAITLITFQSWENSTDEAYTAFKKIANKLVSKGLPAVLSIPSGFKLNENNFKIYLDAFKLFYELLAEGCSLSNAFFELRKELINEGKSSIVYLKDIDSDIFKIEVGTHSNVDKDEASKKENNTNKRSNRISEMEVEDRIRLPIDNVEISASKNLNVTGSKISDEKSFSELKEEQPKKFNPITIRSRNDY